MNAISESRLADLLPKLADLIRQMDAMLSQEGIDLRVVQGLRSWSQQEALYQQGRSTPGPIVTNAQAGYSQHNFGLAVDVAPFVGIIPDWDVNHPTWKRMVQVGESLGLDSGSGFRTFPDWPHFQLTGRWPVTPDDEERQTFLDGGMAAVWEAANL